MAEIVIDEEKNLTATQKKRLQQYQSLGSQSKTKADKDKFNAKYNVLYQKSLSRRLKMHELSMYQQFTEILCIGSSKTLNPSNFLDYLASIITLFIGQNVTVSISKYSSNPLANAGPTIITSVARLIPFHAPRDKVTYAVTVDKQTSNQSQATKRSIVTKHITASYAFAALPDQRLFADGKCNPYVLDDTFKWQTLYGTTCKSPKLENKRTGFQPIVAAAVIGDGERNTFCVYGTRNGLYYNHPQTGAPVLVVADRVDGIFRQHDHLYALMRGPALYSIALADKNRSIAATKLFDTSKKYNVVNLYGTFIGAFYDQDKDRLIIGNDQAQIYMFQNHGKMDEAFSDAYDQFRKQQLRSSSLERGNCLYYDSDRNSLVYIGTKTVTTISLNQDKTGRYAASNKDGSFAKVHDLKW
eukprot:CAMPEP_0202693930 /NCGR_PEP_ID=MMETSP1385-20130828/7930_1 /ASSEMBLY_ACC=CAM_ASM_000861 /TAXON_ID=933848 /ORGANISM="Elphidium margaritaceum" /LENGTH=412 /DNA_ID=CAMNT_0049349693 /DNA_START=15 /DNA_END=1250 /DNA_ORIENTATION=+